MKKGVDYIGVGVGALVFNNQGKVFLAKRAAEVRNESGTWEFPGGGVRFGETLKDAVKREFVEEYGMVIEPHELLCVTDHILPDEHQHWISPSFVATHVSGEPEIREPAKCEAIGWFDINNAPSPLMSVSANCLNTYLNKFGTRPFLPQSHEDT